ncbi:S4 domain-containing protein YaaA [Companilactobacillus ginsenosidimutans]|uniref:RNA-binding S4 protein n=1 Tax=Companilactobacillus ginsenosidimutans TaxID=1007676 RepID=A0A0H4QLS1_9LACO|nr:S4 domain-containing protein YaaA [Companilactobacillus ginsenosidimutans]AKP67648.1 RNA-binding S4 protein [Companilactobacillus ginsenosidimutans]
MSQKIAIETEFITVGQFLKEVGIIGTGGQAKWYLQENSITVNGEPENRRGKKLHKGDTIVAESQTFEIE